MYHFFYKTTNLTNGKFYYGVHNTENINDGYLGSGKILTKAINIYGKECFCREILKFFKTKKDAFDYEKEFVNEEMIKNPLCYNCSIGGKGGSHGKMWAKSIGIKVSKAYKNSSQESKEEKVRKWKETMSSKSYEELNKIHKKQSNSLKISNTKRDPSIKKSQVEKRKETFANKSDEEINEIRNSISVGMKKYCKEHGNNFTGKHHNEETRKRISETMKKIRNK